LPTLGQNRYFSHNHHDSARRSRFGFQEGRREFKDQSLRRLLAAWRSHLLHLHTLRVFSFAFTFDGPTKKKIETAFNCHFGV